MTIIEIDPRSEAGLHLTAVCMALTNTRIGTPIRISPDRSQPNRVMITDAGGMWSYPLRRTFHTRYWCEYRVAAHPEAWLEIEFTTWEEGNAWIDAHLGGDVIDVSAVHDPEQ